MRRFVVGAGAILLFFSLLVFLGAGLNIAFGTTPRPAALGWVLLIASLVLSGYTAERWSPQLAGLLACGVINFCIMLMTGHLIGQPNKPLPYLDAWLGTGLFVLCTTLAVKLEGRVKAIDLVDRGAFALVLLSLATLMFFESAITRGLGMVGMAGSLGALLIRHPRHRRRRSAQMQKVEDGLL